MLHSYIYFRINTEAKLHLRCKCAPGKPTFTYQGGSDAPRSPVKHSQSLPFAGPVCSSSAQLKQVPPIYSADFRHTLVREDNLAQGQRHLYTQAAHSHV